MGHYCPYCFHMHGLYFTVHSMLGSKLFICASCKKLFRTWRSEWGDKGLGGKLWYFLMSVVYAVVVGCFTGMVGLVLAEICKVGRPPVFWVAAVLGGLSVAGLQCLRVR